MEQEVVAVGGVLATEAHQADQTAAGGGGGLDGDGARLGEGVAVVVVARVWWSTGYP